MKNLKLILSTAVAVGAIFGIGAASAADLAVKARPYIAPPPVFTWTGCYVGVHAGAGVMHDQGFDPTEGQRPDDKHGIGGLAGGQIGCNYQTGMLVIGIEGEGSWSGMKITSDNFGFGNTANTLIGSAQIRNKWDYDVAARIGVAFDRALVYGKAGWVVGAFDWNFGTTPAFPFGPQFTNQGGSNLDGLLIGVGLEYAFLNNWTVKFEYDYMGFGAKNVLFNGNCPTCVPVNYTFTQNVSFDKHVFKVGLNYLFNMGPTAVVARY
jgi:outer membrane immunogenic protein